MAGGLAGREEESRKPEGHLMELGEEVICRIVRLKEAHRDWGPRKIRELYRRKQRHEQSGRLEADVEASAPTDL